MGFGDCRKSIEPWKVDRLKIGSSLGFDLQAWHWLKKVSAGSGMERIGPKMDLVTVLVCGLGMGCKTLDCAKGLV